MPFKASPSFDFLVSLDYLGGAMGIPKLRLLPLLVPGSIKRIHPKLENFTTQNSIENLISSVNERKQNHHFKVL